MNVAREKKVGKEGKERKETKENKEKKKKRRKKRGGGRRATTRVSFGEKRGIYIAFKSYFQDSQMTLIYIGPNLDPNL